MFVLTDCVYNHLIWAKRSLINWVSRMRLTPHRWSRISTLDSDSGSKLAEHAALHNRLVVFHRLHRKPNYCCGFSSIFKNASWSWKKKYRKTSSFFNQNKKTKIACPCFSSLCWYPAPKAHLPCSWSQVTSLHPPPHPPLSLWSLSASAMTSDAARTGMAGVSSFHFVVSETFTYSRETWSL